MKIIAPLARLLLGLVFFVFGLNGFLHFIPGPIPPGIAGQYVMALFQSHYYVVIFGAQFLGGVLLLVNRYVPLALTILGPVIVNILCFHLFMLKTGLPLAPSSRSCGHSSCTVTARPFPAFLCSALLSAPRGVALLSWSPTLVSHFR